jgi:hypothetical protein
MECTHSKSCELFAQFALNPALKVWQIHYCEGDQHARCARYQMSLAGQVVPLNLLPNGKIVEAPRDNNAYGATALFNAILKDRTPMVESMLKNGIDINVKTPDGTTPLMAAVARGNIEIMQLLVAKGANVNAQNNAGGTAYTMAMRSGFAPGIALLKASGATAMATTTDAEFDAMANEAPTPKTEASARVVPMPTERKPASMPVEQTGQLGHGYYLRIVAKFDRDVSAKVVNIFRDLGIDTDATMQKRPPEGVKMSSIFVLTTPVAEQTIFKAIAKIEGLGSSVSGVTCMRLEELTGSGKARRAS